MIPLPNGKRLHALTLVTAIIAMFSPALMAQDVVDQRDEYSVRQLTFGETHHHMFGYIGHAGTIPWNASGRYIVGLRTTFHDHMPTVDEPADIVLLDTHHGYAVRVIEQTRAWNLQQGTLLYWNPESPETQFFFNDRDPNDGTPFTVLYDISVGKSGKRIREYRFPESPVANSGVSQVGGHFLALNYGRLARLRPVTGLAGSQDWSRAENAPEDDGIFKVNVSTGERSLLVSYRQLRDAARVKFPNIDDDALFINHTLWNRPSNRIYFYLRANFRSRKTKVDVPFTINADGTGLTRHAYRGGHPEWDDEMILICSEKDRQVRYDTTARKVIGTIGPAGTFPDPGGDIAMSPGGEWFVNGHKDKKQGQTFFTFFNRQTNRLIRTDGFSIGSWTSGELRIDPAPAWNRSSDQVLVGALEPDTETRQLFLIQLHPETPQ